MSQIYGEKTWAQHGEDLMLANIFHLIGVERPSYLDLGAHHPTEISNTKLLYDRGSRGVNVEANPNLIDAFIRERPQDKNVNVGVGAKDDKAIFYMFDQTSGLNSFCPKAVDTILRGDPRQKIQQTKVIEVMGINRLLYEYCNNQWPDLLLTDIEGYDLEVLEAAAFSATNKPKVICTEIRADKADRAKEQLWSQGYLPYCRCQANLIFVDNSYRGFLY